MGDPQVAGCPSRELRGTAGTGGGECEQSGDHLCGRPGLVPDDGGARFVATAGGERVVLAVDEDGVDVPGVGADGLQRDDLSVVVAVDQERERGLYQVADAVEGLAHVEVARWVRGWRRARE